MKVISFIEQREVMRSPVSALEFRLNWGVSFPGREPGEGRSAANMGGIQESPREFGHLQEEKIR